MARASGDAPRWWAPHTLRVKTRRDIRRQLPQFVAIAVTVLLGVALFVASFDAFGNLEASYGVTYERLHFADLTVTGGDIGSFATTATTTPGVAGVTTRTQVDLPMTIGTATPYGRVIGLPPSGQPAVDQVDVVAGSPLDPARPDGVLLERHAADHFGLGPGASLRILGAGGWQDVTVLGVAGSPEYLWPARSRQDIITDPDSFAVVFAPQPLALTLAGATAPNQAAIELTEAGRTDGTADRLAATARADGATDVQTRAEQPSNSALQEDINGFAELSIAFPLLFLTAAAVAAYVLLTRRVLSEKPVIGMLRAAGARRGPIVTHYLGHGVLAGLAGAVPGVLVGVITTTAVTRAYTGAIDVPDTVVARHPASAVAGLVFGVLVGLVGAGAPALSASRVPPAEAMRGIAAADGATPGRWSRAVSRARWLPTTTRMALRDVTRSRRRTAATMTGVVLALVLVMASAGMIDSTRALLHQQFDVVQREDADAIVDPARQDAVVDELRALPGVTAAEPAVTGPMTVSAGDRSYATSITGFVPDTVMHGFVAPSGDPVPLPASGILAGSALAGQLDIGPGDAVTLTAADGSTTATTLVGFLDEPFGTYLYGTLDTATAALGTSPGTLRLGMVQEASGIDRAELRRQMSAVPGVVAVTDADALAQQVDQYLGLFWAFIGMMTVLGGILAFTTIFITMTVNIAERTTELATLRAAGVRLRRIGALLGNENLIATMLGVPIGLVLGWVVADRFMASFSSDMFQFTLHLSWVTIVLSVAAVLGAAALSQLPALRTIRRLDVARVVRERAA